MGHATVNTDYTTDIPLGRRKYSDEIYDAVVESFNALPLAAVIDNKLFCVHGGLSPDLNTLHDIQVVRRKFLLGAQVLTRAISA